MMNWKSYIALYLICTSVFWMVRWIEVVSYWGGAIFIIVALILLYSQRKEHQQGMVKIILLYLGFGLISYHALCFFQFLFSNVRNYPVFGVLLSVIFRLLGYAATSQHGILLINDEGTSYEITIDAEKLALIHGCTLLVTFLFISFFYRTEFRRMILFILLTIVYFCVRFVLLIILYLFAKSFSYQLEHLSLFWSAPFLILTLLPIIFIARLTLDWKKPEFSEFFKKKMVLGSASILIAFACFQISLWLALPGERKIGRILLDDYYSDVWETSAGDYTSSRYGRESVYHMQMARKYLEHFYDVRVNLKPILRDDLREVDVLIIKTPIYRLSDKTLDAIQDFVHRGGGLLLIGDHTDLMGMTSHLNDLSKQFGITYRYDATYDLTTGHDNHSASLEIFRPAVSPLLNNVRMMTTCTMEINPFVVRPIAWVRSSIADEADYSRPSFFGTMEVDLSDEFGCFILGSTSNAGEGKVAAICESTIFSNFGIFTSDREEWLHRLIELVNHRVSPMESPIRILALVLFVFFLLNGYRILRSNRSASDSIAVSFSIAIGLCFGTWIVDRCGPDANMSPPRSTIPWIYFQRNGTTFNLPDAMAHYHAEAVDAFETIYANVPRIGYIPHEVPSISFADQLNAPIILIQPNRTAFSDTLLHWIETGGRILIVIRDSIGVKEIPPDILPREQPLQIRQDSVMVRYVLHGKGRIAYIAPAYAFSRYGIGLLMEEPTPTAKAVLETFYQSIRWITGNE